MATSVHCMQFWLKSDINKNRFPKPGKFKINPPLPPLTEITKSNCWYCTTDTYFTLKNHSRSWLFSLFFIYLFSSVGRMIKTSLKHIPYTYQRMGTVLTTLGLVRILVQISLPGRSVNPIMVGVFNIVIDDKNFKVLDSSLHFEVEPNSVSWTSRELFYFHGIVV